MANRDWQWRGWAPEIDWSLRLFDDVESTVSLGGQRFIRNLAAAYVETGDEKYACKYRDSLFLVSPPITLVNRKPAQCRD